jgi:stage II sporulation protein AB (anti-sigma F factor)
MLNDSKNEAFARVVAASFAAQADVTLEEISDIKTAVSEAVTNAIVHGYSNSVGYVGLDCKLMDAENPLLPVRVLEIEIRDNGRGISDIARARQPLFTTQPELERSGMGFTVMETFMDEVIVDSSPGQGTKVILRKEIGAAGKLPKKSVKSGVDAGSEAGGIDD